MQTCPACKASGRHYVEVFGDTLYKCTACGLIFVHPYPDKNEMVRRHTTKEYSEHPYFAVGEEISEKGGHALHHLVVERLRSHLGTSARILDVGAGSGDFLKLAQEIFLVSAIEPSPYLAEKVRQRIGCQVFTGAFEDYGDSNKFDAVVLMDIIEHTANPRSLLAKAYDSLRPGGILFVCTVDGNSLLYRLGPIFWRLSGIVGKAGYILQRIFCYQHNWYFNRRSLAAIVEECGFMVEEHAGYEFPLERLKENFVIKSGLLFLYFMHNCLGAKTEQYLLARK